MESSALLQGRTFFGSRLELDTLPPPIYTANRPTDKYVSNEVGTMLSANDQRTEFFSTADCTFQANSLTILPACTVFTSCMPMQNP